MKRWFMIVGLGAMVTVGVHEAFAGFKENNPVQVDLPSRTAAGSIGATRRTTDNVQYIGCTVAGDQNGNTVSCFARTANSTSLFCQTTSPFLVQAAAALSG